MHTYVLTYTSTYTYTYVTSGRCLGVGPSNDGIVLVLVLVSAIYVMYGLA